MYCSNTRAVAIAVVRAVVIVIVVARVRARAHALTHTCTQNAHTRTQMEDLRGSPMSVGSLEEMIDDK